MALWLKAVFLLAVPALHAQSVEGALSNSVTRAPVPGSTVTITGPATYKAVADAAGAFRFSVVEPGEHKAEFKKDGFLALYSCQKLFRVRGDTPVRLACEMEPLARLQGRVTYPDCPPVPMGRHVCPERR